MRAALIALGASLFAATAFAQMPARTPAPVAPATSPWFAFDEKSTIFLTGDSWQTSGQSYRLYGVQACLRGTYFTNTHGIKRDCGEAGIAMLVATIRDLRPHCYVAASSADRLSHYVICSASLTKGANIGARLDLGTVLITQGFAFAALNPDASPVHPPYLVSQVMAQKQKAGLWQFADLPDPNVAILRALRRPPAISQQ